LVRPSPKWGIRTVDEVTGWIQRQLTRSLVRSRLSRVPLLFFNSLDKNVVPEIAIPVPSANSSGSVRRAKDSSSRSSRADPDLRIDLSPDPLLRYQAVELNHDERRLLASISRSVSAKDLIAASAIPKRRRRARLYACSFSVW